MILIGLERVCSGTQALSGLVALMRNGKTSCKRVEELREGDTPARAADRLRTGWLKERRDVWLARSPGARDAHSSAGGEPATKAGKSGLAGPPHDGVL